MKTDARLFKGFALSGLLFVAIFPETGHSLEKEIVQKQPTLSVGIFPVALLTNAYAGNVEYLVGPKSSLVAGGVYYAGGGVLSYFGETDGYLLETSFRHHWQPGLASTFTEFFFRYSDQDGKSFVNENGTRKTIHSSLLLAHGGINLGRKWILDNGLTFCFSLGYGVGYTDLKLVAPTVDPDVLNFTKIFTIIMVGTNGELSMGWSF